MSQTLWRAELYNQKLTELFPAPVGPITLMKCMILGEMKRNLRRTYAIIMSFSLMEVWLAALQVTPRAAELSEIPYPGRFLKYWGAEDATSDVGSGGGKIYGLGVMSSANLRVRSLGRSSIVAAGSVPTFSLGAQPRPEVIADSDERQENE